MGSINQSICYGCFTRDDASPEQVIQEAAKIGYKSVEMAPARNIGPSCAKMACA